LPRRKAEKRRRSFRNPPAMTRARGFRIRRANESDVPGILECLHSAFEEYRSRYTPSAFVATVLTERMAHRRLRTMTVWVAVGPGHRVLGTVASKLVSPGHAHLRGMAVLPGHQGKRIATVLLAAAIRHARSARAVRVTLETTEPLQRASRFYLHHGFRRTGHHRRWGGMKLIGFEQLLPAPTLAGKRRGLRTKR
jgi:GNAT superfamily N-acetyltransferase